MQIIKKNWSDLIPNRTYENLSWQAHVDIFINKIEFSTKGCSFTYTSDNIVLCIVISSIDCEVKATIAFQATYKF